MSTIRVLTLGWEFPPLVNGGLGIACLGLSKALAKKVDLRVIVPKADPSVLFDGFQLTGLNNVSYREVEQVDRKYSYDSFALVERAPIELDPYTTVEGGSGVVQFTKEGRITFSKTHEADLQLFRNKEDLYAGDLALKVIQFSKIAVKVALQQDFDIIHAHDWMTYLAGVEVKKATGKPLVVHLHASQFDRAGADARGWIYDIEKFGMEQADAGRYDLILMDVQMPEMDGYEATRRIRALPDKKKAAIPIVAMTANAFEEDQKNALNAGMNGHIAKPLDIQKLFQVLSELLK